LATITITTTRDASTPTKR